MKRQSVISRQEIFSDRSMLIGLVSLVLSAVLFTTLVSINIHPGELQVNTHYTSFGTENFYRTPWHYLLGFVGFGLFVGLVHSIIALKLFSKNRNVALVFIWLSIAVLGISTVLALKALSIAALS